MNEFCFNSKRRFGVEIETNSSDKRDFVCNPLYDGEMPLGIDYIENLISKSLETRVCVQSWGYNHNNTYWVIKTDRSCGIEICSPVSVGINGLNKICKVIDLLKDDKDVNIDSRCSLHVHVEVEDCSMEELAKILIYWIKCEPIFLDLMPLNRKKNKYCQCIGSSELFNHNFKDYLSVIKMLGTHKYYTINTYHYNKKNRKTIEFRILGEEGCTDSETTKNWIMLLIHFVEITRKMSFPCLYEKGNPWSSLLWLDPQDFFKLLNFDILDDEIKSWVLKRLKNNYNKDVRGFWNRKYLLKQL